MTRRNTLFTSKAHYYEPAGEVSWDVAMGATPPDWRVKLPAGDKLSVHATYDTSKASWYEVMGIMPVAVYNGTDVGGVERRSARTSLRTASSRTAISPRTATTAASPPRPAGTR